MNPGHDKLETIDNGHVSLAKRLGFLGFLFFLIKGLLWLAVPSVIAWFGFH